MSTIDVNDRTEEVRDFTSDMNGRALGVTWDVNEDAFYHVMRQVCARDDVTRCMMVSNIATLYDSLGTRADYSHRGAREDFISGSHSPQVGLGRACSRGPRHQVASLVEVATES